MQIDWKKLAQQQGYTSDYQMFLQFRRKKLSSISIARILGGVSDQSIRHKMESYSIKRLSVGTRGQPIKRLHKRRDFSKYIKHYRRKNEKDLLFWMYWTQNKTPKEIAKLLDCPWPTIQTRLRINGIARRKRGPTHARRQS